MDGIVDYGRNMMVTSMKKVLGRQVGILSKAAPQKKIWKLL